MNPAAAFSVVTISSHPLLNDLLRVAFEHVPEARIAIRTNSVERAVTDAGDTAPDVVILDILASTSPEAKNAVRAALRAWPTTAVIVLARSEDDEVLFDSIFVGACGFLTMQSSADDLVDAVRHAAAHELVFNPNFARKLLDEVRERSATQETGRKGQTKLSARELEVLRLVAQGHSNQRIASEMHVSPSTVKNHLYSAYQKIGVTSRSQAVAQAVKMRLLSL